MRTGSASAHSDDGNRMIRSTLQALVHQATVLALRLLPDERRVPLERRMRGRYDAQRLARTNVVVVSYGKSGRTWARVMLSRYFQLRYAVSPRRLLTLDRKSTRLNSSHIQKSRMPSSA